MPTDLPPLIQFNDLFTRDGQINTAGLSGWLTAQGLVPRTANLVASQIAREVSSGRLTGLQVGHPAFLYDLLVRAEQGGGAATSGGAVTSITSSTVTGWVQATAADMEGARSRYQAIAGQPQPAAPATARPQVTSRITAGRPSLHPPRQTQPAPAPISGGGGSGGRGGPGGIPTLPPNASDAEFDSYIRTHYGNVAWVLGVPELRSGLRQAAQEGWDANRLAGWLTGTEWWRTTTPSVREFTRRQSEDPAGLQHDIDVRSGVLSDLASRFGINIDPERVRGLATDATKYGWDDNATNEALGAEFQRHIDAGGVLGGDALTLANTYRGLANDYAVPVSDTTVNQWVRQTIEGSVDEDNVRGWYVENAKSLFPGLADALDRGITVRQYADPYVQLAARELEIDPDSINLADGKWNRPLSYAGPDGQPTTMSLFDWQRTVRNDAIYGWDSTAGARQAAAEFNTRILQSFGAI